MAAFIYIFSAHFKKKDLGSYLACEGFPLLLKNRISNFYIFAAKLWVVQYTGLWDYKRKGWGPHVIFGPEVILYSVNE